MLASLFLAGLTLGAATGQGRDDYGGVIDDRSSPQSTGSQIPANEGWVTDLGGMLSPQEEQELETLMESYKQGTTHEIALLTVTNLKGRPIEEFALGVYREWGVGSKATSNGALLVVSKSDRLIRIEVGRGLEGSLTDAASGRIIRNVIVPEFKRGRFSAGLKNGVVAIHDAIGGKPVQAPRAPQSAGPVEVGLAGLLCPLFAIALFVLFLVFAIRRGARFTGRRRAWWSPTLNPGIFLLSSLGGGSGGGGFGGGGGGFSGFGGGGGASGGGASGGW